MTNTEDVDNLPHIAQVFNALKQSPGLALSVDEISETTGLQRGQIQQAIIKMRKRSDDVRAQVQVIAPGNMWLWKPQVPPSAPPASAEVATNGAPVKPASVRPAATQRALPVEPASQFGDGVRPLFEQVGSYEGEVLLRDEHGKHWLARRLETGR